MKKGYPKHVDGVFRCCNCKRIIDNETLIGSSHRNHCPFCGYSLHVDNIKGDRASPCKGTMKPIGLVFKTGDELCLVHQCLSCGKINYNRVAGDDDAEMLLDVLNKSYALDKVLIEKLTGESISLIKQNDEDKVRTQLFGKNSD